MHAWLIGACYCHVISYGRIEVRQNFLKDTHTIAGEDLGGAIDAIASLSIPGLFPVHFLQKLLCTPTPCRKPASSPEESQYTHRVLSYKRWPWFVWVYIHTPYLAPSQGTIIRILFAVKSCKTLHVWRVELECSANTDRRQYRNTTNIDISQRLSPL